MDLPDLVPVFPLPDHVLLIGVPMPYRIFEPRYRELVDDLLGREPADRLVAVPRLSAGWEDDYHGNPAFVPIAVVGLVRNIRPLADGQFLVVIEGVQRCHLDERPSDHPYRLAHPDPIADQGEDPAVIAAGVHGLLGQVERLRARLGKRGEALGMLIGETSDQGALVDRLGAALLGDLGDRQTFLEARRMSDRIALIRRSLDAVLAQLRSPIRWDPSPN